MISGDTQDPAPTVTQPGSGGGFNKFGCLAVIGLILVHTVVGAIIGIPILVVCFVLFFIDAIRRLRSQTTSGVCPLCAADISVAGTPVRCICHACQGAIAFAGGTFVASAPAA